MECLESALQSLGYRRGKPIGYRYDWRRGRYHVTLRQRREGFVSLQIHKDARFHVGRARAKGGDLEEELKKIIRRCRAS